MLRGTPPDTGPQEQHLLVIAFPDRRTGRPGVEAIVKRVTADPSGVKRNSGSPVRSPTTVMLILASPVMVQSPDPGPVAACTGSAPDCCVGHGGPDELVSAQP